MKKILSIFTLLLITGTLVMAQTVQITGTVTSSEDKGAMPGVFVSVKGTTLGSITGPDGKFSISAPASATTLVASFVGYKSIEVPIEGKTKIDIVLEQDVFKVDEVVVVGYGTQKKREITGAINSVKGDELKSLATPSFESQLAGKSTGVLITKSSGVLGTVPRMMVRGQGSINSGTYPLIVVDGVPIQTGDLGGDASTNSLGDINPADIESMEILKDGSATAIYGSRAANGVMLITTKRGSQGKMKLTYNNYFGYAQPIRLFKLLKANDFVTISNEKRANAGQGIIAQNDGANYPGQTFDTDWQKAVLNMRAIQQDHSLSLSGASDQSNYYFSLGYTNQDGVTRPNSMKRFTARANVDQKVRKWLTMGANIGVTRTDYSGLNTGNNSLSGNIWSAIRQLPNTPVYNPNNPTGYNIDDYYVNGVLSNYPAPINTGGDANVVGRWNNLDKQTDNAPNIVYVIDHNVYSSVIYRVIGNAYAQINFLPSLNFKTQIGVDNSLGEGLYYWNSQHGDGRSVNGRINNDYSKGVIWNIQNILSFNKTFLNDHNVALVGVNEIQFTRNNSFYGQGTDISNTFFNKNLISGTFGTQLAGGSMSEQGFISYAGRLNYNYKGKYFLQGSVRYDGISSLPDANKWGLFPGASVGWTVSKESFMSGISNVVSDLKVRGSYAKVGNTNIGRYPYLGLYGSAKYADYNGIAFSQMGNDQLQWETSTKYDAGFDVLFFAGKYKLTFDWFLNNQDGLILAAPIAPSLGVPGNSVNKNIGAMKNSGYEISGEAFILRNKDLTWSVDANLTLIENKVTALYQHKDLTYNHYIVREGESFNAIFAYKYMGVNAANGNPLYLKADGTTIQGNIANSSWRAYDPNNPADVSVAAAALTTADKSIIGSSLPKFYGGFGTKAEYKGIDFAASFRFSGGNYIYNRTRVDLLGMNFQNNGTEILGRWQSTSNPGDGWTPRLYYGASTFINQPDQGLTRFIEKGNYVKLSNITLGYTLPRNLVRKAGIENLRVFVQGQDLLMFTKYTGPDPEMADGTGRDFNSTPNQRVVTFGISLTL
jgi:TonB-dependent starch-binding outer membrane protein SusC